MKQSLEKRFRILRHSVAGVRSKDSFSFSDKPSLEEKEGIVPATPWQRRILSEFDFCLQMKQYARVDVEASVGSALLVLENALAEHGVLGNEACREAEKQLLPLEAEAQTYTLLLVGHAHIDMNWMWSYDETVATTLATFRTMLRLMEEYPDFCFSQSQASTYQIVEKYAPEMMPEIQKRIREGRWEVTASAWVETDKNMPSFESLLNHLVYTKKYLSEHWGVDPATLNIDFSPDTFGHSAFLPELDAMGGVSYYYHCRGLGEMDKILYRWRAPSGKELLMYQEPYWYNSGITPDPAIGLPRIASLCGGLKVGMAVYGVGDHGGGPTRRDLNQALEMQNWPVFPRLKFGRLKDYFQAAEAVRQVVPVVDHELNLIFTGCYTTQSRIKKGNRRAETGLIQAETLSALMARELDQPYGTEAFETAWQKVLFTHFHDILTGSCVPDSREYAGALYQEAMATAQTRAATALEALAAAIDTSGLKVEEDALSRSEGAGVGFGLHKGGIPTRENGRGMTRILHIVNPTGTERHENALLTVWDWPGNFQLMEVVDPEGNPVSFERTSDWEIYWAHRYFTMLVTVTVPAYGYCTVLLREKDPVEETDAHLNDRHPHDRCHSPVEDVVLENKYLRVVIDRRSGSLVSLIDKTTGKERIRPGAAGGLRYIQAQRHRMSAWVIDRYLKVMPADEMVSMTPLGGTLNPGVRMEYNIAGSHAATTINLGSEDRYLKIHVEAEWLEQAARGNDFQPLLSYCVPLADSTGRVLCDVAGGVQWRPDQEIDVPCLRYAAAELKDGKVLALASNSKYGYRLSGGDLFVTLINTAFKPDSYPEYGSHDAMLYLLAGEPDGAFLASQTDRCLQPLQFMTNMPHKGTLPLQGGLLKTEGRSVVFSGVAQRKDKLAVRMYECAGESCPVTVTCCGAVEEATVCDLLENDLGIPVTVSGNGVSFTLPPYHQAELHIK